MVEDNYSYENLKNFVYIDNVEKETTRFYGPANSNIYRIARSSHHLQGMPIHQGTLLSLHMFGTHYSPKYYKDPTAFRPERWEGECDNVPAFAIGGFSAGPRTCIGKHLAKLEAKIGLIKFMKRYERVEAEDAKFILRFLYQPKEVVVRLTKA